jgi:uncharacterized membrane protein YoaK (UPF0700 family)
MTPATSTSPVLLSAPEVLSRRHAPSLLAIALAAGAVNAGAFEVSERFVTHVTGAVTRIGVDAEVMVESSLVLLAFVSGAMASVLAIGGRVARGKRALHAVPLLGAAAIVFGAAALGSAGVFGPVTGGKEQTSVLFLIVLAFAMGLLNAGVASSTALAVRTTHMSGPSTDFGVSLATALLSEGEPRRQAFALAGLRGGSVASFVAGAALMFPLVGVFGFGAFVAPAAVLVVATLRSFAPGSLLVPPEEGLRS